MLASDLCLACFLTFYCCDLSLLHAFILIVICESTYSNCWISMDIYKALAIGCAHTSSSNKSSVLIATIASYIIYNITFYTCIQTEITFTMCVVRTVFTTMRVVKHI